MIQLVVRLFVAQQVAPVVGEPQFLADGVPCAFLPLAFADNQKEQERVKESGEVLKEILNIPDDIPQDLLDKAECVVVLPSVKKAAFGIGGSFGRGAMRFFKKSIGIPL